MYLLGACGSVDGETPVRGVPQSSLDRCWEFHVLYCNVRISRLPFLSWQFPDRGTPRVTRYRMCNTKQPAFSAWQRKS